MTNYGTRSQLWDLASGRELCSRKVADQLLGPDTALALAPDGRTLAIGHDDSTVVLWDLSPREVSAGPTLLSGAELEALASDLAGTDAAKAFRAGGALAARPAQALPLLRDRLRLAAPVPAEQVQRLLADLDSDHFKTRQAASQRLGDLGTAVEAPLREALRRTRSPEVRWRLRDLLAPNSPLEQDTLFAHRAIRVLEQIGNREARQVLKRLAAGDPDSRRTREAQAALWRLGPRPLGSAGEPQTSN